MANNPGFKVLLKKGSRTVRQVHAPSWDKAKEIAETWYQEADGNAYEIMDAPEPLDQVSPRIESDRYLTQQPIDSTHGIRLS